MSIKRDFTNSEIIPESGRLTSQPVYIPKIPKTSGIPNEFYIMVAGSPSTSYEVYEACLELHSKSDGKLSIIDRILGRK